MAHCQSIRYNHKVIDPVVESIARKNEKWIRSDERVSLHSSVSLSERVDRIARPVQLDKGIAASYVICESDVFLVGVQPQPLSGGPISNGAVSESQHGKIVIRRAG